MAGPLICLEKAHVNYDKFSEWRDSYMPSTGQAANANSSAATLSLCFSPSWLQNLPINDFTWAVGMVSFSSSVEIFLKLFATSFLFVSLETASISLKVPAERFHFAWSSAKAHIRCTQLQSSPKALQDWYNNSYTLDSSTYLPWVITE